MAITGNKTEVVESIISDISIGIWDFGPCEPCGAKEDGSCCGCPKEWVYQEKLAPYKEVLGEDAFGETVAIGKLKHQIATAQEELEKREKKLEKLLSPKHTEMLKKRAEVTAYFSAFGED